MLALGGKKCRGGENRTPINGFGDHCPTIERRPLALYVSTQDYSRNEVGV